MGLAYLAGLVDGELTARHSGLSEDGVPRFPVGVSVPVPEIQG